MTFRALTAVCGIATGFVGTRGSQAWWYTHKNKSVARSGMAHHRRGLRSPGVTASHRRIPLTLHLAARQSAVMELSGEISGWKCGATNDPAQAGLGLTEPFRGPLYPEMILEAGRESPPHEPFDIEYMGVMGVEAEFGIHLHRSLPPREEPYRMKEVSGSRPPQQACLRMSALSLAGCVAGL